MMIKSNEFCIFIGTSFFVWTRTARVAEVDYWYQRSVQEPTAEQTYIQYLVLQRS